MHVKRPRPIHKTIGWYYTVKALKAHAEYELMIEESKAKLSETTLVPGVVQIYA